MMVVRPEISEREVEALRRARAKAELLNWLRGEAAARNGVMAWYVARTQWAADSVANDLRDAGIEVVCPLRRIWRRHPRSMRRYSVEIPTLGNYVFVRTVIAESAWLGVMSFDGVDCLLGNGEKPVPVLKAEMANIMDMLEETSACPVEQATGLVLGDTVLHPLGMMAELRGTVIEIDAEKREALISTVLFGRQMATRCGIDDLEKLA